MSRAAGEPGTFSGRTGFPVGGGTAGTAGQRETDRRETAAVVFRRPSFRGYPGGSERA